MSELMEHVLYRRKVASRFLQFWLVQLYLHHLNSVKRMPQTEEETRPLMDITNHVVSVCLRRELISRDQIPDFVNSTDIRSDSSDTELSVPDRRL